MPSTNGRGPKKRAALYARVSTDEQAKKGYSVGGQLDELRTDVEAYGREIVADIRDEGYGRETLERPGIDELYELAESGAIDEVWAWQRDRYGASPCPEVLSIKLSGYGVELRALDDVGEGDDAYLLHGLKDLMAKEELRKTLRRSRMGKENKAKQGKIIAGAKVPYGFRLNEERDGFVIDEDSMPVVRRIFYMYGEEGRSLHDVKRTFEAEGVRAPMGGEVWSTATIKNIVLNPVYGGVWHYNKHYTATTRTVKLPNGEYKKRRTHRLRPREDWIAVPVPDAGIPLEAAEAARRRVEANTKPPKKSNNRYWELAGGMLRCGECGRAMVGHPVRGKWFYYRCHRTPKSSGKNPCPNKLHRAEPLEARVQGFVFWELLRNPETMRARAEAQTQRERERLSSAEPKIAALNARREEIARERDRYNRLYAKGSIGDAEHDRYTAELYEERDAVEREIESFGDQEQRLKELDALPGYVEDYLAELPHFVDGMPIIREYEPKEHEDQHVKKPYLLTPESFRKNHRFLSEEELEEKRRAAKEERARRYRWFYELVGLEVVAHKDGTLEVSWKFGEHHVLLPVNGSESSKGAMSNNIAR